MYYTPIVRIRTSLARKRVAHAFYSMSLFRTEEHFSAQVAKLKEIKFANESLKLEMLDRRRFKTE